MHVVITGGLGFIGSRAARRMIGAGHRVTLLDNMVSPVTDDVPGARVLQADLLDWEALQALDIPPCDCLMHIGGASSGPASIKDPVGTVGGGYAMTYNALSLAGRLGARRFLFTSSMTVYGDVDPEDCPINEQAPCRPISHYGIGKYANERLVEIYCRDHGIGFNNFRLFNVYGPGQDLSRGDQGLVSIFLALLMKNPKVVSKGSLERFRDIVHVDDVVGALCLCADEAVISGPFNVGCGEAMTIGDLIGEIADALGIGDQLEIRTAEATPGDMFGICADITALRSATGFSPRYRPRDGIRQFVKWALRPKTAGQTNKDS